MTDPQAESRREFLKKAGTVAWMSPLILTMTSSAAHAQGSCLPDGLDCGLISQGGICNQFANCCGVCVYPGTGTTCRCTAPF